LADDSPAGQFAVPSVGNDRKRILLNAVAVHDNNGDHKSKEWGARRLATLYRFENGKFSPSGYDDGLFILDGEWEKKDVARLYRCGWNHICRLGGLEGVLKKIFGVKDKVKRAKVNLAVIRLGEGDEDT
jgi:hypothetical protein